MFYTKYRPQKFSEISRPNQAADALSTQVIKGKVAHAYLFVGPRGTGKTTTARILAKSLNCKNVIDNGDPCGDCVVCTGISSNSYIDLIEIDAASNRGIDDIRDLKDKINLAPSHGTRKVYIIDEVHMLTNEAFNALLKTLEEPPRNVHFVLCTTEVHKVPETIKSRCQIFRFKRATVKQIVDKLAYIVKEEGAKIPKKDLEKIAKASYGGFRDAETMLEQVVEGGIDVDTFLESSISANFEDFVKMLHTGTCKDAISLINDLYTNGVDLYFWCGGLLSYLRDLLFVKSGVGVEEDFEDIPEISLGETIKIVEVFSEIHPQIKTAFIPQLPLEIGILGFCNDAPIHEALPKTDFVETPVEKKVKHEVKEEPKTAVVKQVSAKLEEVVSMWDQVIQRVFEINASVSALLKNAVPVSIVDNLIVLQVYYPFHKERLNADRNSTLVKQVLADVYGRPIRFECELGSNKPEIIVDSGLTDLNVTVPGSKEPVSTDDLINMLDGSLPL